MVCMLLPASELTSFLLRKVQHGMLSCWPGKFKVFVYTPTRLSASPRKTTSACGARRAARLSLARMQMLLGDRIFLNAVSGGDAYLCAALRSLPLYERDNADACVDAHEEGLARELLAQVAAEAEGVRPFFLSNLLWLQGHSHWGTGPARVVLLVRRCLQHNGSRHGGASEQRKCGMPTANSCAAIQVGAESLASCNAHAAAAVLQQGIVLSLMHAL